MSLLTEVTEAITEILDIEESSITEDTYLIRDLGAESIDLLELTVELNKRTGTEIVDDHLFMRRLREHLIEVEATHQNPEIFLMEKYPFLSRQRVKDIISDLEGGPVLKVGDLASYLNWKGAYGP
ncbi:acyl carrier protein [Desulfovermiculus halophilus]|jgi:acyl carrier protein|uniref:acyl carrier protein n=1 Tax=Desulfovermiculus halophilus TaxID=339722 RepID=UPI00054E7BCD|nr:phosphopantetheine-binding protein [Desulfovermiculus halophilus]